MSQARRRTRGAAAQGAAAGQAGPGQPFDPGAGGTPPVTAVAGASRAAPAPQSPLTQARLRALKARAAQPTAKPPARAKGAVPGQPDPAFKPAKRTRG